jgi:hypothetical protein
MRVQKLSIASESISNAVATGSDNEFRFPLLLSPEMIQAEKTALDDAINNASGIKKADAEKIKEAIDALHMAALTSYKYCLNYRTGIVNQDGSPTGQTKETLMSQNVPMVNGRPVRIGDSCWLNSFDNGDIQRLGSFDCKKKAFFDQVERSFQEDLTEKGLTVAPSQDNVDNPFGNQ